MIAVVHHGRQLTADLTQAFFINDHDVDTGSTDILLGARIESVRAITDLMKDFNQKKA